MPPALLELDQSVSRFLQVQAHSAGLSALFGFTSSLLDLSGIVALLVLLGLRLAGRRAPRLAAFVGAFLLAGALTLVLKGFTGRENVPLYNPYPPDPIGQSLNPAPYLARALHGSDANAEGFLTSLVPEGLRRFLHDALGTSFPSGHAARAGALAVSGALLWPSLRWPFAGAALWVAFSRAYIGAHWPLDVLAGLLLGAACGALVALLASGRRRRVAPRGRGYRVGR